MSHVMYNGKRMIPAPFVSIQKTFDRAGDTQKIGKTYNIVLRGSLVAFKGSPMSDKTWYTGSDYPPDETVGDTSRLASLLRKQEALRTLFSTDGLTLEIQSMDGSQPLKCNPRIINIEIADGTWYDRVEYTITVEADKLYPETDSSTDNLDYISDFSENWAIETNEDQYESYGLGRTYRLSHSINAKGKRFYDETGTLTKEAWEQARDFVQPRLGFDSQIMLSSGVNYLPSYYNGFNLIRSEDIDKIGGGYSVSENWVLASGKATESFSINMENSLDNPYKSVTIDGDIVGFEERNSDMSLSSTKWDNALAKFVAVSGLAHSRAQTFSGLNLNVIPLSFTQGRNPITGTISYGIQYNTRPMRLIDGAISESVTISNSNRGDVFAAIFCIGREAGPILQYLGASTEATRSLNIEVVISPTVYTDTSLSTLKSLMNTTPRTNPLYSGAIANLIDAANPIFNGFTTSLRSAPQESWDFLTGRYSYNVTWTYE